MVSSTTPTTLRSIGGTLRVWGGTLRVWGGTLALALCACASLDTDPIGAGSAPDAATAMDSGRPTPTEPDAGPAAVDAGPPAVDAGADAGTRPKTPTVLASLVDRNVTLDPDSEYYFREDLTVKAGFTLTIGPGTTLYARDRDSRIVVEKGGRIVARGEPTRPIVFTSLFERNGLGQTRDWGGLRVDGDSAVLDNAAADLRYVRIENAGAVPQSTTSTAPALHLVDIGTASSLDYVQLWRSAGQGLRVEGGGFHINHLVVTDAVGEGVLLGASATKAFDGSGQFWIIHTGLLTSVSAGIEFDAAGGSFANITVVGAGATAASGLSHGLYATPTRNAEEYAVYNALIAELPGFGVEHGTGNTSSPTGLMGPAVFANSIVSTIGGRTFFNGDATTFEEDKFRNKVDPPPPSDSTSPPPSNLPAGIGPNLYIPTTTPTSTFDPASLGAPFVPAPFVGGVNSPNDNWVARGSWARASNGQVL